MVDQGFDTVHCPLLERRRGQRMRRLVRPSWHVIDALLDYPEALPHLLDPQLDPVVTVTPLSGWNLELEPFVARIWTYFSPVPREAAGAQHGAGGSPVDGVLEADGSNAHGAV